MSKSTSQMTDVELARAFAEVAGIKGRVGGHIYDRNGRHLAHGWQALADHLARRGVIREGQGINWNHPYSQRLQGNR